MRGRLLLAWTITLAPWGVPQRATAQDAAKQPDGKPASSNIRGAEYPRIHADLGVTFKLKAPDPNCLLGSGRIFLAFAASPSLPVLAA